MKCEKCKGVGIIECPGCNNVKDNYICAGCKGTGHVKCGICGGKNIYKQRKNKLKRILDE